MCVKKISTLRCQFQMCSETSHSPLRQIKLRTLKIICWFAHRFLLQQLSGLVKGASYHVRVSAYNGVALSYGKARSSTPPVVHPGDAPESPPRVEVEAASPTSLGISWSSPNDAMGREVTGYQVVRESRWRVKQWEQWRRAFREYM